MPAHWLRETVLPLSRQSEPRIEATRAVHQVLSGGRSLGDVLPEDSLARALCYGVLRYLPRLEALAAQYLKRPLKRRDRELEILILIGIFELGWLNTAEHAAVNRTVGATAFLNRRWARGLVNAVLRAYQRAGKPRAPERPDPAAVSCHPGWLTAALEEAWGDRVSAVIAANNEPAPMWIRVNLAKTTLKACQERLNAAGIESSGSPWSATALRLSRPVDVTDLPGFASGQVSVQDLSAQLAGPLLNLQPGQSVLDACAAPGGKTGHLLEIGGDISLTAVDQSPVRADRIRQNLDRLGAKAQIEVADATAWAAETSSRYERILLDAPCTGTGVIRRHPDIKWLRHPNDPAALAAVQRQLLDALWPLLKTGGYLLYATCSILPVENDHQLAGFVDSRDDAQISVIQGHWGLATRTGRQILPGEENADGFFYGLIEKI